MASVYNSWAQNSHNTYDFQAPTGDGTPFGLYFDAGIIKKDARPLINATDDPHGKPYVDGTFYYTGKSTYYTDYENGEWNYDDPDFPYFKTTKKPIKFYSGQVITISGGQEHNGISMQVFYIGRVLGVYQPPGNEDGSFDDSTILIKCITILKDTLLGGYTIDNWTIDYAGSNYSNYVQNYNDASKMSISGGRATIDFPLTSEYNSEPEFNEYGDPDTGNWGFDVSYVWGSRFIVIEDDEKHLPWSGIEVGVSHVQLTATSETTITNTLTTATSYGEHGGVYNYDYIETEQNINYSYDQTPISITYTFDALDYELTKQSQIYDPESPDYNPDANYVDNGERIIIETVDHTASNFNTGSYGDAEYGEFVCDEYDEGGACIAGHIEWHTESYDFREVSYFPTTDVYVNTYLGNYADYNLKDIEDEPGVSGRKEIDFTSPYWPQNPKGSGTDFITSDKYEYPDPPSFFYFKPTDE